jgi:hypothetical protein
MGCSVCRTVTRAGRLIPLYDHIAGNATALVVHASKVFSDNPDRDELYGSQKGHHDYD